MGIETLALIAGAASAINALTAAVAAYLRTRGDRPTSRVAQLLVRYVDTTVITSGDKKASTASDVTGQPTS